MRISSVGLGDGWINQTDVGGWVDGCGWVGGWMDCCSFLFAVLKGCCYEDEKPTRFNWTCRCRTIFLHLC